MNMEEEYYDKNESEEEYFGEMKTYFERCRNAKIGEIYWVFGRFTRNWSKARLSRIPMRADVLEHTLIADDGDIFYRKRSEMWSEEEYRAIRGKILTYKLGI